MGIRRHESDLERAGLLGPLEDPVCCADACVGSSEDNDVLHGVTPKTWIMDLSKAIPSEEVKDNVNGLLKSARGETENIRHCEY